MPKTKQPKVSTGNVISFSRGVLSSVAGTASRVAPGAAYVGAINDTINVGQGVWQGNGAEAVSSLSSRIVRLTLFLSVASASAIAQSLPTSDAPAIAASEITAAPPKMSRYVATHEGSRSVFRRDPNIWVMTPVVAERSGMPKEWASTELKGVAAAAFRREPEGAEQDCGFGGNKNACRPVINCVLELYFDRNTHLLPWREGSPVADFDNRRGSSNDHQAFGGGVNPMTGAKSRLGLGVSPDRQPFSDPDGGAGLYWWWTSSIYMAGTGKSRVMAYDREMHGSFSYLKLETGCTGKDLNGEALALQLRDARSNVIKQFHEIYLPASWTKRVDALSKSARQLDESFYKGVFESINAKEGEKK